MSIESATIEQEDSVAEPMAYGTDFWLSYFANTALIICLSLLFRYADYVSYLGGDEKNLGFITGCGMVGALLSRLGQGPLIDRIGPKTVWLISLVILIVSLASHLFIDSFGPAILIARVCYMIGLAGAFGASLTSISLKAPPGRNAELIGVLGSSGFIGLGIGPILSDWIYGLQGEEVLRSQVNLMFLYAIVAAFVSLVLAIAATWRDQPVVREKHPSPIRLIAYYHPGWILYMSFVMGVGILLPQIFLRSFTDAMEIGGIRVFFVVYAITAFTVRLGTAKFADRYGVKNITILGMVFLSISVLSYLVVDNQLLLAFPAVFGGLAHAFLFPAIIGGGSSAFPKKFRGTGTNLMLATLDTGGLIGQPVIGLTISVARKQGYPAYETMFVMLACFLVASTLAYFIFGKKTISEGLEEDYESQTQVS